MKACNTEEEDESGVYFKVSNIKILTHFVFAVSLYSTNLLI